MRKFFTKKGVVIIAAAALIALITLVSLNVGGSAGVFTSAVNAVTRPFKVMTATVASQFESIYGYMHKYDAVAAENAELKKQLSQLEQDYREYIETSAENERLRGLLDLASRHADYKFDTGTIISWGSNNFTSSFVVSKGSDNSDIAVGDSVINEAGAIVGVITDVGTKTSTGVTVIDTKFSAGAVIESSGDNAVASGDFALMRDGRLRLEFLTDGTRFVSGDSVVTSGKGGVYPKGLLIGSVDEALRDDGTGRSASIAPAIEPGNIMEVFIITEFESFE